jgi:signal transduction protein with GAF and PtsI domain
MTADLMLLQQRHELLCARIAATTDPYLRENLQSDLRAIIDRIETLSHPAA